MKIFFLSLVLYQYNLVIKISFFSHFFPETFLKILKQIFFYKRIIFSLKFSTVHALYLSILFFYSFVFYSNYFYCYHFQNLSSPFVYFLPLLFLISIIKGWGTESWYFSSIADVTHVHRNFSRSRFINSLLSLVYFFSTIISLLLNNLRLKNSFLSVFIHKEYKYDLIL